MLLDCSITKMEWINDSVASSDAVVISPLYCARQVVHLTFTKKAPGVKSGHLAVVDAYDRVMYRFERHHSWTVRDRMLLLDASDQPILLVQSQRKSSHAAYDVYRGDSRDAKDLLFSIRKASKVEVHVCLASNHKKHSVDFKIRGNFKKRTIEVHKAESEHTVAEMSQEQIHSDKEAFGVTLSPNVDSCFIAALFAVLPRIYHSSAKSACRASKKSGFEKASKKTGHKKTSTQSAYAEESKQTESQEDSETSESEEESEETEHEESAETEFEESETSTEELPDAVGVGLLEVFQSVLEAFSE